MDQNLDPSLPQPLTSISHPPTPASLPSSTGDPLSTSFSKAVDATSPSTATDPSFVPVSQIASTFTQTTNLSSSSLGARIIAYSDQFFAPADSLLSPKPPLNKPDLYVETGKWMDGWETRRHNHKPFDWVIIRLGTAAGKVVGVEVDTAFFNGNQAPAVSLEGCFIVKDVEVVEDERVGDMLRGNVSDDDSDGTNEKARWRILLRKKACGPSARHAWLVEAGSTQEPVTHVRLRMYPDGGIARLRVYGTAVPVWPDDPKTEVELSAAQMGGLAVACSDEHFGKMENLLLPGRGVDMSDGWETKRSRGIGHVDWAVIKLGARGRVRKIVVDTMHFRGNFPRAIKIEGCDAGEVGNWEKGEWIEVAEEQSTQADVELECVLTPGISGRVFSHMRLTMIPDGGVKRFRVFGTRV